MFLEAEATKLRRLESGWSVEQHVQVEQNGVAINIAILPWPCPSCANASHSPFTEMKVKYLSQQEEGFRMHLCKQPYRSSCVGVSYFGQILSWMTEGAVSFADWWTNPRPGQARNNSWVTAMDVCSITCLMEKLGALEEGFSLGLREFFSEEMIGFVNMKKAQYKFVFSGRDEQFHPSQAMRTKRNLPICGTKEQSTNILQLINN